MKINVNIPMNSKRTRVLASFMAFLIFALTFQQAFVGWDIGLRVKAESNPLTGPNIYINTEKTSINALKSGHTANGGKFTYTGNIKAQAVSMYDYLSDEEIKNSGSWNTGITKSKVTGYSDPYTVFNQATSNDGTLISSANNNITIVLQNSGYSANDDVRIYMKNGSSSLQWPGEKMTYKNGEFVYTFSTTNSNRVGFTPTQVKFSINGSSEKPGGGEQYYGNDIVQNQNGTNVYAPNYTF